MKIQKISDLINNLKKLGNSEKAARVKKFFKTGKNQYSENDIFWGISIPEIRKISHTYKDLSINNLQKLLQHKVHEIRLCALLIMVFKSKKNSEEMYNLYLQNMQFVNNWDLVDLSSHQIVGNFLIDKDTSILYNLAQSNILWKQRIAIVSTFAFIKQGQYIHTLQIAEILMQNKHDLIHKAVGWMLREVGKRCSTEVLENFLEKYADKMPRTMLRYAVEHFNPEKKKYFMNM